MGALSGSMTLSAFTVDGDLPKDFRDRYLAALGRRAFHEIDLNSDSDESLGWVATRDPFDTAFDLNKVLWGDYLLATLRHDSIRIPPAVFKLHLGKALADYQAKTGKERLSKFDEDEVRDVLLKSLRRRVLPSIKTYDMVWNVERKSVWLFTSNKRVSEVFQEYFADTFELTLIPQSAYALLERMGDEALLERALMIEPANLVVNARGEGE